MTAVMLDIQTSVTFHGLFTVCCVQNNLNTMHV